MPKFSNGCPPFYETQRNNARFLIEKIGEKVDPCKIYPLAGPCQLVHCHYKCTVYFDELYWADYPIPFNHRKARVEVVYIDKDHLRRCGGPAVATTPPVIACRVDSTPELRPSPAAALGPRGSVVSYAKNGKSRFSSSFDGCEPYSQTSNASAVFTALPASVAELLDELAAEAVGRRRVAARRRVRRVQASRSALSLGTSSR